MLTTGRFAQVATVAVVTVVFACSLAHAQSPLGIGAAEPSFSTTGPFGGILSLVNRYQQEFYRAMTGALKGMRQDPWQLTSLIGLSFAYGVFHAAGPGHGKAVISSYMLANETQLRRGILISFISAFMQGAVAILLVGAAYLVLRGSSISMTRATQWLEIASFALVALFGAWLLFRKLKAMFFVRLEPAPMRAQASSVATAEISPNLAIPQPVFRLRHRDGDHITHATGANGVCETCGNSHAPDPTLLKADRFSVKEAWSAIVAVGLRPCSGALLVLTFSLLNGLYLGGLLSVLAMSVGTAITVSILAILAVSAKDLAMRYAGPGSTASMRVANGIELLGAALVLVMGLLLLGAALA